MRVVHVLRKPLSEGTVAANTLRHGCGGLNIDASRITLEPDSRLTKGGSYSGNRTGSNTPSMFNGGNGKVEYTPPPGRWPANVILQHLDGCRRTGTRAVKGYQINRFTDGAKHFGGAAGHPYEGTAMKGGVETVWACAPGCPAVALDEQSGVTKGVVRQPTGKAVYPTDGVAVNWNSNSVLDNAVRGFGDVGGASRFFKQVRP